jgi:hypothetical protein
MARQKSLFLSAFGTAFEIWKTLVEAVIARGGTDDDLRRILTNKTLVARIANLIVVKPVVATFQSLLAACQQDGVHPDFIEEHFPLEPVAPDEDEWEVYEHRFEETMNGEEAFRRLEGLGYRFCGVRRAMEFIADLRLNHPLIVTVRWQDPCDHYWYVPVFDQGGVERVLDLRFLANGFEPHYCRWLVLRKRG